MATRKDFFEVVSDFDFKIKAYVVDKMSIDKDIFKDNEKFYEFFLVKAFEAFAKDFDQAKVHFDGKSSRVYKKKIKTNINNVLKKKGVKIDDIKFLDSKSDQLIQLADMCAGLIKKNLDLSNIALCAMYNKLKKKIEIKRFE